MRALLAATALMGAFVAGGQSSAKHRMLVREGMNCSYGEDPARQRRQHLQDHSLKWPELLGRPHPTLDLHMHMRCIGSLRFVAREDAVRND